MMRESRAPFSFLERRERRWRVVEFTGDGAKEYPDSPEHGWAEVVIEEGPVG